MNISITAFDKNDKFATQHTLVEDSESVPHLPQVGDTIDFADGDAEIVARKFRYDFDPDHLTIILTVKPLKESGVETFAKLGRS